MPFAAFSPLLALLISYGRFSVQSRQSAERESPRSGRCLTFPDCRLKRRTWTPPYLAFFCFFFFGGKLIFWTWSIWTGNSILVILFSVCFLYKIHIFGILIVGGESSQSRGTSLLSFLPFGGVWSDFDGQWTVGTARIHISPHFPFFPPYNYATGRHFLCPPTVPPSSQWQPVIFTLF